MAPVFGNPQIKMTQQTSLRVDFPSGPFNYQERKTAGPSHYQSPQTGQLRPREVPSRHAQLSAKASQVAWRPHTSSKTPAEGCMIEGFGAHDSVGHGIKAIADTMG